MGKRLTVDDFIQKARKVHGDKYDYSKVDYKNNSTKVCIICPEHGEFWQTPNSHLLGSGCPSCSNVKKKTTEDFIKEAKEIHGGKYDYSKTDYINERTKVIITCPIHGDFLQLPKNHLRGQGCPECGKEIVAKRENTSVNKRKTQEEFQTELNSLFNGKYELMSEYINNKTPVKIFCHNKGKDGKEHGVFEARPDMLSQKHGCPKCFHTESNGESEVYEFIRKNYEGTIIKRDRTILKGKEIDIYLPELSLGFEYDGLLWHSEKFTEGYTIQEKTNLCEKNGIHLIHIFEDEWINKKDICCSRILSLLGKSNRIYARKCEIKEVEFKTAKVFLDDNHLQGSVPAKYNIGLFYEGKLVSLMCFSSLRRNLGSKPRKDYYEMIRFCNLIGYSVIGGASKLLNYFKKKYKPIEIISFADRRWSDGKLYYRLNFTFKGNTKPNYYYIFQNNNFKRYNRFSLRKSVLVEKYNCPKEQSEHDFCKEHNIWRIYDSGNMKFIMHIDYDRK